MIQYSESCDSDSIISEAIFGWGASDIIARRQPFLANYAKIIDVAVATYNGYQADEALLDRKIAREEFVYYATALLHLKLIEVKKKQSHKVLTSQEKDLRSGTEDKQFNIPQPLYAYLQQVGTYTNNTGQEMALEIPSLPITVGVQDMGGYHANAVNSNTHNLFEEVPSLGIAGDMLMALASEDAEPVPNFHIGKPEWSEFTTNLIGNFSPIGQRRPEIIQRLAGYGITVDSFDEYVPYTRFNLLYIKSLSDIIGKFQTYPIAKTSFKNLGHSGGETQVIKTQPVHKDGIENWRSRSVQAMSASPAIEGAAICFGFQLYKEDGGGEDRAAKTSNWSCIRGNGEAPWNMPDDWYNNRNLRRNLPEENRTERFRAISQRQDNMLFNLVRGMIKTLR